MKNYCTYKEYSKLELDDQPVSSTRVLYSWLFLVVFFFYKQNYPIISTNKKKGASIRNILVHTNKTIRKKTLVRSNPTIKTKTQQTNKTEWNTLTKPRSTKHGYGTSLIRIVSRGKKCMMLWIIRKRRLPNRSIWHLTQTLLITPGITQLILVIHGSQSHGPHKTPLKGWLF